MNISGYMTYARNFFAPTSLALTNSSPITPFFQLNNHMNLNHLLPFLGILSFLHNLFCRKAKQEEEVPKLLQECKEVAIVFSKILEQNQAVQNEQVSSKVTQELTNVMRDLQIVFVNFLEKLDHSSMEIQLEVELKQIMNLLEKASRVLEGDNNITLDNGVAMVEAYCETTDIDETKEELLPTQACDNYTSQPTIYNQGGKKKKIVYDLSSDDDDDENEEEKVDDQSSIFTKNKKRVMASTCDSSPECKRQII